jgi:hypothetical protein
VDPTQEEGLIMRTMLIVAAVLTVPTFCAAEDKKTVEFEIPFEKLRTFLPADGEVVELHRKKNVWPKEQGEDKDEWIQISFGKALKARTGDRTKEKETSLGTGITAKDGYIELKAGWRVRQDLKVEHHFDGTLTARLAFTMSRGKWDARVEDVKVNWNRFELVPDVVSPVIEAKIREEGRKQLTAALNDKMKEYMDGKPLMKAVASQLSGSLVGDKFVIRALPLEPLLDLGAVRDRRGDKKVTVEAKNYDKLKVEIIDRSEVDASAATVFSTIDVTNKIDGRSVVSFKTAPKATVVVRGKIDGQSTVHIDAPDGHVEFHDEINGQSHLHITAKSVIFHKKIDGGWVNKGNKDERITEVHLTLSNDGWVSAPELCGHMYWKRADPKGSAPKVAISKVHWDGKLEEQK